MMSKMRFRRETGSSEVVWAEGPVEFAPTAVAAPCSTAGGNCHDPADSDWQGDYCKAENNGG